MRSRCRGCNSAALGKPTYVAVASPLFHQETISVSRRRHGRDAGASTGHHLQSHRSIAGTVGSALGCRKEVDTPTQWLPSNAVPYRWDALPGIGWGMNPLALVREYLNAGTLVEFGSR